MSCATAFRTAEAEAAQARLAEWTSRLTASALDKDDEAAIVAALILCAVLVLLRVAVAVVDLWNAFGQPYTP